jgi:peptidoglycan/xylan/chitin deacetylase (PgdA/CDA1 family)
MKTLATSGIAAAGGAALLAWAVRGRTAAVFGPSEWRGPRDRAVVALTFDDGPSEGTPAILDVLGRYGVPATFFQVGANVDRVPQIARAVRDAGHEIGNHSYSHSLLCFRSARFMENDLRRAQETIARHTGSEPAWFRAPFGVRWFGLRAAQSRLGLGGVMWTVIGYDWSLGAEEVVDRILRRISKGAILCLHDGRELQARPDTGVTLEAVRRLVPKLLDQGYRFETISRLLCPTI